MVSFMPKPLYPWGESHQYPSARRLCGVQSWSSYFGEKKNLLTLLATEPWISACPAHGLVTIPNNYRCNNIPLKCNNEENWEKMWHAWTISLKSSSWLTLALTSRYGGINKWIHFFFFLADSVPNCLTTRKNTIYFCEATDILKSP